MNIPARIRDYASLVDGLYEMSTGGGCDYICLSVDKTTDLILCDPEDSGSPGFIWDRQEFSDPLYCPATVMAQISDFDEPHAWNAGGGSIMFGGTVKECIVFMEKVAKLNNITSEPNY